MNSSFQVQIVLMSSVRVLGAENKGKRSEKRTKENICFRWGCAVCSFLCVSVLKSEGSLAIPCTVSNSINNKHFSIKQTIQLLIH